MSLFQRFRKRLSKERASPEQAVSMPVLTQREQEVFRLLVEGCTLKETAQQLGIKYSTANTHMTGIYKKLGVNSRAALIIRYGNLYH